jgi:GNAT superfamily N-acetyltransferase
MPEHSSASIRPTIQIRKATVDDIPEILRQRRGMYEDMDCNDAVALADMVALTTAYLQKAIPEGSFLAWLAMIDDRIAGGGAVVISPWPAHPHNQECRRATILNVYTHREFRRRGVARKIMQTMIDWCSREGFAQVTLHASPDGRPLYEALGFEVSNEMKLKLR